MIAACSSNDVVSKTQMTMSVVQFVTAVFIIGWIMSIYWGYLIVQKALDAKNSVETFANADDGRAQLGGRVGPGGGMNQFSNAY